MHVKVYRKEVIKGKIENNWDVIVEKNDEDD